MISNHVFFQELLEKCVVVYRWLHRSKRHFIIFLPSIFCSYVFLFIYTSLAFALFSLLFHFVLAFWHKTQRWLIRAWKHCSIKHLMNSIHFHIKEKHHIIAHQKHFLRIIQFGVRQKIAYKRLPLPSNWEARNTNKMRFTCDVRTKQASADFIHAFERTTE